MSDKTILTRLGNLADRVEQARDGFLDQGKYILTYSVIAAELRTMIQMIHSSRLPEIREGSQPAGTQVSGAT